MDAKLYNAIENYRNAMNLALTALDTLIMESQSEALGEIVLTEINLHAARLRAKKTKVGV